MAIMNSDGVMGRHDTGKERGVMHKDKREIAVIKTVSFFSQGTLSFVNPKGLI